MANIQLYPHQLDALRRMKNGCVVRGGVGSGKSITSIAYYYLQNGGSVSSLTGGDYIPMDTCIPDLYIITTARKRDTFEWEKELTPFLLSTSKEGNLYSNQVIVDSWNNIQKYKDVKHAFFIFDEQRAIGSGVWAKSFIRIAKNNRWILLSATPGDTWTDYIPLFIANGFYKNRTEFSREHIVYSQYCTNFPKIDHFIGTGKLLKLREMILVDMEFKRHTEALNECVWSEYDIKKYKSIIKTRWNPWKEQPIENAGELYYCLRRAVNEDESRGKALVEISKKHEKLIVFYSFDYELDILKSLPYPKGTVVAEWNGHNHEPIPKSDRWVYLVNYSAGSEGWNCTETNAMVFYSLHYSYKVLVQARGRIDRLNTPFKALYYYQLRSRSSIDIAIAKANEDKRIFNENRRSLKLVVGAREAERTFKE